MRTTHLVVTFALLAGAVGCSSSTNSASTSSGTSSDTASASAAGKTMPDVTGQKLDAAETAIQSAGVDPSKIEIIGGGTFGVAVKSNWTVCSQVPAAGQPLPASPQLTIERDCAAATGSAADSSTPPGATSSASTSSQPLTTANSPDLAALLQVGDGCDAPVATFVTKYSGQQIQFAGSIASLTNHGSYTTRYDILVAQGDDGPNFLRGPNFQFQDVNLTNDLHFEGRAPSSIAVGTKLTFTATVDSYNQTSCLLQLTPVSTTAR